MNAPAGVSQGSLISPLLFWLFVMPLYETLCGVNELETVGFADDTNLLACGIDTAHCVACAGRGMGDWRKMSNGTKHGFRAGQKLADPLLQHGDRPNRNFKILIR